MTISEQIKVLCVRSDISVAELARRIGTTPQNFNGKMKRESFTVEYIWNYFSDFRIERVGYDI